MPWWAWIAIGAVLLCTELFLIPTDFFLVLLGFSAIAVGMIDLVGGESAPWVEWATFGGLSLLSLVLLRGWLKAHLAPGGPRRVDDTMAGEIGIARERLEPGATGRVELRGTSWSARNVSDAVLGPGTRVRVVGVDGLTLQVHRET